MGDHDATCSRTVTREADKLYQRTGALVQIDIVYTKSRDCSMTFILEKVTCNDQYILKCNAVKVQVNGEKLQVKRTLSLE